MERARVLRLAGRQFLHEINRLAGWWLRATSMWSCAALVAACGTGGSAEAADPVDAAGEAQPGTDADVADTLADSETYANGGTAEVAVDSLPPSDTTNAEIGAPAAPGATLWSWTATAAGLGVLAEIGDGSVAIARNGKITLIHPGTGSVLGAATVGSTIKHLAAADDGGLWVLRTGQILRLDAGLATVASQPAVTVSFLCLGPDGSAWVGDDVAAGKGRLRRLGADLNEIAMVSLDGGVSGGLCDASGAVYVEAGTSTRAYGAAGQLLWGKKKSYVELGEHSAAQATTWCFHNANELRCRKRSNGDVAWEAQMASNATFQASPMVAQSGDVWLFGPQCQSFTGSGTTTKCTNTGWGVYTIGSSGSPMAKWWLGNFDSSVAKADNPTAAQDGNGGVYAALGRSVQGLQVNGAKLGKLWSAELSSTVDGQALLTSQGALVLPTTAGVVALQAKPPAPGAWSQAFGGPHRRATVSGIYY